VVNAFSQREAGTQDALTGSDTMRMAGLRTKEDVATLVKAVAPRPVNVLVMGPGITVAEYADIGVRRISVGGALAQVAGAAVLQAAKDLKADSVEGLTTGLAGTELNTLFERFA
jgi:2-methylisocitrate lyase-like PEP mutase family enzyme